MSLDPHIRTALIEAVRRVSVAEILPRFRNLAPDQIASKSAPDDLVTEADRAAEAAIAAAVADILPGALVVGEEATAAAPALPARLADAGTAVIIDPVDGTWNYAHGLSVFGVILSVMQGGRTVFGLHYDPINDDWIEAALGEGTWLVRDSRHRLTLPPRPPRLASELFGLIPVWLFPPETRDAMIMAQTHFGRTGSLRCSCHEYRLLAQGSVDFLLSATAKPWDHAAGVLLATEAGGTARMLDGSDWRPGISKGPLLVARDEATSEAVGAVFSAM